ncbi:MAG: hypothetical protein KC910_11180 [Candidatus Eremiobacteraeota bacterium]|nr:hypothetical protein [Candidatus Eremiobacteraeota bacterium]
MKPSTTQESALSKVPEVTLLFWVLKIVATTLGETGGDAVSMSMNLGYLVGTAIFGAIFMVAVVVQIRARSFHPVIYWLTIVATTTVGTTMADFCDRSLGIGYAGGSLILLVLLITSLVAWRYTLGTISVESVSTPRAEAFYWTTIMFSQTLGTALGDWTADSEGMGYLTSALLFGGLLAILAGLHYFTQVNSTALFWAAFVLTRPLGAVVGDFLDKPHSEGGLELSRYVASAVLVAFMAGGIAFFSHRPARQSH